MSEYSEKLTDPRWQKKRLQIFQRDGWRCRSCGDEYETLHVHHIFYFPGKDPWDIPDGFLLTLCEPCHQNKKDRNNDDLLKEVIGKLLQTIWESEIWEDPDYYINICNVVYSIKG